MLLHLEVRRGFRAIAMVLGLTMLLTATTLVGAPLRASADGEGPADYGDPGTGTGSISGIVTVPAGEVVDAIYLELTPADGRDYFSINVQPSITGTYTFPSLPDGDYYVCTNSAYFTGYLIGQCYDGRPQFDGAAVPITGGAPTTGIDFDLAQGGKVAGTVTVNGGGPATGYGWATIYDAGQGYVTFGSVDPSDGSYTTDAMPAGTYYVHFENFDNGAPEWYDGAAEFDSATPITVTVGATATANAVLGEPGSISGTVTVTGGAAATGGQVDAYVDGEWSSSGTASVDGSGAFSIAGLLPGDYLLEFNYFDNGVHTWYSGADSRDNATPVNVSAGATTPITAELALGGRIGGNVTVAGGGAAGFGTVEILDSDGAIASTEYVESMGYLSGALAPGEYRVYFVDFAGRAYEWYDDSPSFHGSAPVTVTVGETTTADAALEPESVISGTVTDTDGSPATGGCVYAEEYWYDQTSTSGQYQAACVDASGHYEIHGLAAGDYLLSFSYFDGHDSTIWAGPVTTTEGATTVFDYHFALPGSITATVTLEGGAPATSGCVTASLTDSDHITHYGGYSGGYYPGGETCDAVDGIYTVSGLEPGEYEVRFSGFGDYATEWYDGAYSYEDITPVIVTEDADTAIAAELELGGSVSGTVTLEGGGPAIGASVVARSTSSADYVGSATTDDAGAYAIPGLPAGDVILSFGGLETVVDEYFDDAPSVVDATPVSITAGGTAEVDAVLASAGAIAGTVSLDAGGVLDSGGLVYITDTSGNDVTFTYVDFDGTYSIASLPPGDYRVFFGDNWYYASEWYDDAPLGSLATPVTVTAGATTIVNGSLGAPSTISGTVTNPTGSPFGVVVAYDADGRSSSIAWTNIFGDYTLRELGAGDYTVQFVDFPGAADEWYSDKASMAQAIPVTVGAGEDVVGIDATVGAESVISGILTIPDTFTSGTACVGAFIETDAASPVGYACGAAGDPFAISSLPAATYYLRMIDTVYSYTYVNNWADFAGEDAWYDDAWTSGTATPVALAEGQSLAVTFSWSGPPPAITDVSPVSGSTAGGTTVTITGTALTGAAGVFFDGEAGTDVSVASDTQLTVTTPAHAAGPVSVIVTTPGGASFAAEYMYVVMPVVSQVTYSSGPTGGGSPVVITGSGFTGATSVTFGGVAGTSLTVSSDTRITVAAPAHAVGPVDLVVTTPSGSSSPVTFSYYEGDAQGAIVGTVSGPGGAPAGPGHFELSYYWEPLGTGGDVEADGSFVQPVVPDDYQICFYEFVGLANACYDDGSGEPLSDLISVAAGEFVDLSIELAPAGEISGTVTDGEGTSLTGGYVFADPAAGEDSLGGFAEVVDGSYVMSNLAAGDYVVQFAGFDSFGDQWYSGVSSMATATPVTVVAGANLSGIDAVLGAEAFITGTVAVPADFVGTDACVGVYDEGGTWVTGDCSTVGDTFSFGALSAGTYNVRVINDDGSSVWGPDGWDAYSGPDGWYANADTFAAATGVTVSAGETAVIDLRWDDPAITDVSPTSGPTAGGTTVTLTGSAFTGATGVTFDGVAGTALSVTNDGELMVVSPAHAAGAVDVVVTTPYGSSSAATFTYVDVPGGKIAGTVTVSGGGPAGQGLVDILTDGDTVVATVAIDEADAGQFLTARLAPGDYYVRFSSFAGSAYEWYDDSPHIIGSVTVTVTAEATTTANAELGAESVISGTVTEPDGSPASGGCVFPYELDEDGSRYISAGNAGTCDIDPMGHYEIHGLSAGSYLLGFVEFDGHPDSEWIYWTSVTAGGTTILDFQFTNPGSITATVTLDGSAPATGGCVIAQRTYPYVDDIGQTCDGVGGVYTVPGLHTGDYEVSFVGFDGAVDKQYESYVTVGSGADSAISADLEVAGAVSGTVTIEGVGPAVGATVIAHDESYFELGVATTDGEGNYVLSGLAAGDVFLEFFDDDFAVPEYFDDAYGFAYASPVTVVASATTTADAVLARAGVIAGTVSLDSAAPIASIGEVNVFDASGDFAGWTYTESDGSYSIPHLPPGDYRVRFSEFSDGAAEWYDEATSLGSATPVTVTAGAITTVNEGLTAPSTISGTVTNPSGSDSGQIYLYDAEDGRILDWVYSESDGSYTFTGLAAGDYFVEFRGFGGAAAEWYDDQLLIAQATPIAVGVGEDVTGIDATLAPESMISGTLTVPDTFTSGGACVGAYIDRGAANPVQSWCYTTGEVFSIDSLPAATYYLRLIDTDWGYASQYDWIDFTGEDAWYDDALSSASATPIVLGQGLNFAVTLSWTSPLPTVSDLSPVQGTELGGTVVTVTGTNLTGATSVTFDGVEGTGVSVASDTSLTVTTPVHDPGVVDVVVTTPEGVSAAEAFTYVSSDTPGTISGRVTGPGGTDPGEGFIDIWYYDQAIGDGNLPVAADGTFSYNVQPGEVYGVWFHGFAGLADEAYDDAVAVATPVSVAAGEHVIINAELAVAGTISGTVTNAGGSPLTDGYVFVYTAAGDYVSGYPVEGDGSYVIPNRAAGDYFVQFSEFVGYGKQWYSGASSMAAATPVTVVAGANLSGIDAVLGAEAFITGTVAVPADFVGTDACVGVYDSGDTWVNGDCSTVGGAFSIGGLGAGTYKVRVMDDDEGGVWGKGGWDDYSGTDAWYANADTFASATGVTVSAGETAVIDLIWDEPAVTDVSPTSGSTLGGTTVTITGSAFTGATGITFDGVTGTGLSVTNDGELTVVAPAHAAGAVDVIVTTPYGSSTPTTFTYETPTTGTITGTVTMEGVGAVSGCGIHLLDEGGDFLLSACSDASGHYSIENLAAGTYIIEFYGFEWGAHEFYDDAPTRETATPVVVMAGEATTGVDAELVLGGQISGTITMEGGAPATGGYVSVMADGGNYVGGSGVDASGNYNATGLPAGTYLINFSGFDAAADEWYDDSLGSGSATPVAVIAGETTTGVDAELALGGQLSGTVTLEGGAAATGGRVTAYDVAGGEVAWEDDFTDGQYSIVHLVPGTYYLEFRGFDGGVNEWYDDAPDFDTATPVTVLAGETTTTSMRNSRWVADLRHGDDRGWCPRDRGIRSGLLCRS